MLAKPQPPRIQLPRGWRGCVKSAVVYTISLAHYTIVHARAWAADSINARVRLATENDRLHEECALLREELRLKDARIAQIVPQRRPHTARCAFPYAPVAGNRGAPIRLDVRYDGGRKHLPIVELRLAA